MIPVNADFAAQKSLDGYFVIYTVELPSLGLYFSTVNPSFTGTWVAGLGVIAGGGVVAASNLPDYVTALQQIRQGGLGDISFEFDVDGFARTGNFSFRLLNQELISHSILENYIVNSPVIVRVGFNSLPIEDYIIIFKGVVDKYSADINTFTVESIDETLRQFVPVPPQFGADFFPRSFAQGAIPILLGDLDFVPGIQIIGDTSATLAFGITTSSTTLFIIEANATFPQTGQLEITSDSGVSTVSYSSIQTVVLDYRIYARFIIDNPSFDHTAGSPVVLVNHPYRYALGFLGENTTGFLAAGGFPTVAPVVRNIGLGAGDSRRITVLDYGEEQDSPTASIAGGGRGINLFPNGNNRDNVDNDPEQEGWVIVNGALSREIFPGRVSPSLSINFLPAQSVPTEAYVDIPVEVGKRYRFKFQYQNVSTDFGQVLVGTTTDDSLYFSFTELASTNPIRLETIFVSEESTVRVTVAAFSPSPATGDEQFSFNNFDLYDLETENPSHQLAYLIETHMPFIKVNRESFDESFDLWSGDRLAGIIQNTEESQELLGRIAQQFRAKTFLNERGEQKLVVFDQSRKPIASINERDVLKGSFSLPSVPSDSVYSSFFVYFDRRSEAGENLGGRQAFRGVVFCTPEGTNHTVEDGLNVLCQEAKELFRTDRVFEVFADCIPDIQTAENLLSYIVRRYTQQPYIIQFTSFLNIIDAEIGDFIRVTHYLMDEEHQGQNFEVLHKTISPNGCVVSIAAQYIDPFSFGSFTETWDNVENEAAIVVILETWDIDDTLELFDAPCNPFIETWDILGESQVLELNKFRPDAFTHNMALLNKYDFIEASPQKLYAHGPFEIEQDGYSINAFYNNVQIFSAGGFEILREQFGANPSNNFGGDFVSHWILFTNQEIAPFDDGEFEDASSTMRAVVLHQQGENLDSTPYTREYFHSDFRIFEPKFPPGFSVFESKPWISFPDLNSNWTLRVVFKIDTKDFLQPVLSRKSILLDVEGFDYIVQVLLWYDPTLDRFVFGTGFGVDTSLAPYYTVEAEYTAITNKVVADTLGSPSIDTYYQAVLQWNRTDEEASIFINDLAADTESITPDGYVYKDTDEYTFEREFDGLPESPLRNVFGGVDLYAGIFPSGKYVAREISGQENEGGFVLHGAIGEISGWTRLLSTDEIETLYNSGDFLAITTGYL